MRMGIVLASRDPETAWNAFRFGVKAVEGGHTVRCFLLGAAVECEAIRGGPYDVAEQMRAFAERGGAVLACGTCLRARQMEGTELCPLSTMQDLVDLTVWADRLLTF